MKVESANFANLVTKLVALATSLERLQINNRLMKRFHTSTNLENLMKIGLVDFVITG